MNKRPTYEVMAAELEKMSLPPETFCLAPYITTDLDQDGSVLTCYRGKTRLGNWKEQPFGESFNGKKIQDIRKDLILGIENKNCVSCYNAEKKGSVSPRMNFFFDYINGWITTPGVDMFDKIKRNFKKGDIEDIARIEIRPSSLCNQRCMHCGPHSSTKWIETLANEENYRIYEENDGILRNGMGPIDHKELRWDNIVSYYKGSLTSDTKYKDDIMHLLDSSSIVNFTGGEPLLTPEHSEYLDYFVNKTGSSTSKVLEYSTNLNIKNIERYFDYWREFKTVTFRISIDSCFDTYNYFRTFGNIDLIKENLKKITAFKEQCKQDKKAKIKIFASITFNFFSALRWREIAQDWSDYGLEFHASLILDHPVSVKYLPRDLSQRALTEMQWCIDNAEQYFADKFEKDAFIHHTKNCMNFIQGFKNQFNTFDPMVIKYIDFCDKTSGNNVLDYYPELEEYLKL